jgi:DNA polymerase elongation subunit (family B)
MEESKEVQTGISAESALFGADPLPGVVAVEPEEESILIYRRVGEQVVTERRPFRPWIALEREPPFPLPGAELSRLEGGAMSVLAEFPSVSAWQNARFKIRDEHLEHHTYASLIRLALVRAGITLFKQTSFEQIHRVQFDLETVGLSPDPDENRILLIALSDSRGLVELIEGDEREILERFVARIRELDPDVLEGHNVFGFDLPYLMTRAQKAGVRLAIGRDGSEPRKGAERNYAIGGTTRPFVPVYIYGRHVVDTYLVVQRFDWARGALTSYGLKECARVFGFAQEDRVELPRHEMARLYAEERELVKLYAAQDVMETRSLADLITPVEFYQAQMVPDNYGSVVVTGNGEKINTLFVRAYLAAGRGLSLPQSSRPFPGGYVELRKAGTLDHVVKADVESLYPSLMLTHAIAPATDTLGVFLPMLRDLTRRRLEAKRRASEGTNRDYWDGLQGSFKVLINSFYGYLGGSFNWNDYDAARRVTELGRDLVQDVARQMEETGSQVIEIDTDGVYFVPPPEVDGEEAERAYIAKIGSGLREGIRLAFDGRFARMLSVKTKNYVLQTYEGKRIYKGASLRSRADERFGRKFLARAIDYLLERDYAAVAALYEQTIEDILNGRIPLEDLARRERVTEKTFQSEQKRRSASVARGVAVGEHVMVYERADGELGLLSDGSGEPNKRYYMDKLFRFARRLEDAFGGAFDTYIVKPRADGIVKDTQTSLDLFG